MGRDGSERKSDLEGDRVDSAPRPRPLSGCRVLLADDEPNLRRILARILELKGAEVVQAIDGAEALRYYEDGPPFDVIIADHQMPNRTGTELLVHIDETQSGTQPGPELLLISGNFTERPVGLPEQARLLTKPFEIPRFIEVVLGLVGSSMDRPEAAPPRR